MTLGGGSARGSAESKECWTNVWLKSERAPSTLVRCGLRGFICEKLADIVASARGCAAVSLVVPSSEKLRWSLVLLFIMNLKYINQKPAPAPLASPIIMLLCMNRLCFMGGASSHCSRITQYRSTTANGLESNPPSA